MYTVLIVDDENLLCDGVKAKLERARVPGIANIRVAYGGLEGLRVAGEMRPDIVFTDIRMPELDGIELLKRLRESLPGTRFVMLSGYGDYEYVREAFKYGAQDYLLKPASSAELAAQAQAAIAAIEEARREPRDDTRRETRSDAFDREVLAARLVRLMHGADEKDAAAGGEQALAEQPPGGPFTRPGFALALLSLGGTPYDVQALGRIDAALREGIAEERPEADMRFLALHDVQGQPCVVWNYASSVSADRLAGLLETAVARLAEAADGAPAPVAAISGQGGAGELAKLYKQALQAMAYRILREPCRVLRFDALPASDAHGRADDWFPGKKDIEELRHAAETLQLDRLGDWIDKWFDDALRDRVPLEPFKAMYDLLLTELHRRIDGRLLLEESEQAHAFSSFRSLGELRLYAKEHARRMKQIANERSNLDGTVISVAEAIVREHYARDLQLAEVANRVSMNYSYFSKLFKERTGLTFTAYLIKVRMEEAHKLLKDPSARINEISEKVGYGNLYHFSRAFKNYYGVSPKEYRKTM